MTKYGWLTEDERNILQRRLDGMTNYEWLVSEGLLAQFIADLQDNTVSDVVMNKRYGHIPQVSDRSYSEDVTAWLQEEHKEPDVYVKLTDVIDTICDLDARNALINNAFADICVRQIRKLPTKIIDEPRGSICQ